MLLCSELHVRLWWENKLFGSVWGQPLTHAQMQRVWSSPQYCGESESSWGALAGRTPAHMHMEKESPVKCHTTSHSCLVSFFKCMPFIRGSCQQIIDVISQILLTTLSFSCMHVHRRVWLTLYILEEGSGEEGVGRKQVCLCLSVYNEQCRR